ncbi:MAG: hypothetical protein A2Z14_02005 [Chloroflexi bacterium RBG_16_48_8]|nr:MAG: hypothetical protein A2Z14_02005 [Chloroflexi bacterium RBG_16_48_8]
MYLIETDIMRDTCSVGVQSIPLPDSGKARSPLLILNAGQVVAPYQQAIFQHGSRVAAPNAAECSLSVGHATRVRAAQIP